MYSTRLPKLLPLVEASGADALLVSRPANVLYLSGFRGSEGWLLLTPERQFIITDFRYHERVRSEVDPVYELEDCSGRRLSEVLPPLLEACMIQRLAVEADAISHLGFQRLAGMPGIELVETIGLIDGLRAVKEPEEVELLRAATLLGERIYKEVLGLLGAEVSEADIAAEIEYRARKYGASACSFAPIIAGGPRSAIPHAGFTRERIAPAVPLIIDMGVVLDDYCSDMSRTVFLGGCPAEWERIYSLVRDAKDIAFSLLRPGVMARDVDAAARRFLTDAGYGKDFGHGLGHGVGLPFKGAPVLHWDSDDVLAAGNVASNEPGIYLPGQGGVRIEDVFVVTEDGAEYLNELGTELTVIG